MRFLPVAEATEANQTWLKGQTNSFKLESFDESLALIFGDLSPSSASAHMNYLIKLLKSNFLNVAAAGSMT